jgi:hypothetical protein
VLNNLPEKPARRVSEDQRPHSPLILVLRIALVAVAYILLARVLFPLFLPDEQLQALAGKQGIEFDSPAELYRSLKQAAVRIRDSRKDGEYMALPTCATPPSQQRQGSRLDHPDFPRN